jgi:long-chain acyl-CoA synthetase
MVELIKNDGYKAKIMEEITRQGKESKINGFEFPKKMHISLDAFSVENEILTPTFKMKRNDCKKYFLKEIKAMYEGSKLQGEE